MLPPFEVAVRIFGRYHLEIFDGLFDPIGGRKGRENKAQAREMALRDERRDQSNEKRKNEEKVQEERRRGRKGLRGDATNKVRGREGQTTGRRRGGRRERRGGRRRGLRAIRKSGFIREEGETEENYF